MTPRAAAGLALAAALAAAPAVAAPEGAPEAARPAASAEPRAAQSARPAPAPPSCPFGVGERAEYAVTFGPVKVGRASLEAEAVDTLRGTPALRAALEMRGGTFFYHLDDRQVTWMASRPLRSLRFEQHLREGSYRRDRRYALDQDSGTYRRFDQAEDGSWRPPPGDEDVSQGVPMPPAALDEIAFLYFARTLPLEPGRSYQFSRYFEADGNPVVLRVLRRETITVPAGRFRTLVVRPIIKTGGLFGEGGKALIYFSDDERRVIVQLQTSMSVGRLNMYLEDYRPPDADFAPPPCGG